MTISSWAQLVSLIGFAHWLEAFRSYQEFQSYVDICSERRLLSCSFFAVVLMARLVAWTCRAFDRGYCWKIPPGMIS
jgi:hypothetical protein